MKVVKAQNQKDIEKLKPIAMQWKDTCNADRFRIQLTPETHFADLAGLIDRDDAELFLLINEDGNVVGYIGVICFDSPLGNQKMAQEHYWYASGENKGRGTVLLMRAIKEWAKKKGCSHLVLNASMLASNMHDKVCRFYERIGFVKFETSYIKEI